MLTVKLTDGTTLYLQDASPVPSSDDVLCLNGKLGGTDGDGEFVILTVPLHQLSYSIYEVDA